MKSKLIIISYILLMSGVISAQEKPENALKI
jgi:hypothetical protein